MYINGILLGVLGTLSAELAIVVVAAVLYAIRAGGNHTPRNP